MAYYHDDDWDLDDEDRLALARWYAARWRSVRVLRSPLLCDVPDDRPQWENDDGGDLPPRY